MQDDRQKALEHFPFQLIETTGDDALTKWQELKSAGRGSPVILGGDDELRSFDNMIARFGPRGSNVPPLQSVDDILAAAAGITFPDDLAKRKRTDIEAFLGGSEYEPEGPPLGEWPAAPHPRLGLSIIRSFITRKPVAKAYLGLVPTDDGTTVPAYLRWGGWNDCPAPEYHVAAMRTWRDRYGAELIGMNSDTINMRVAAKPKTRKEALALARDQHIYCSDVIDQGVQTYSAHAADLMANDWWFFWWD